MPIRLHLEDTEGRFVADDAQGQLGEMTFRREPDGTVVVEHTRVDERGRGRGIGRALFDALVRWARAERVAVVPQCSFAARLFESVPEARDVLKRAT